MSGVGEGYRLETLLSLCRSEEDARRQALARAARQALAARQAHAAAEARLAEASRFQPGETTIADLTRERAWLERLARELAEAAERAAGAERAEAAAHEALAEAVRERMALETHRERWLAARKLERERREE